MSGGPCDFHCGYYDSGDDLLDHMLHEHKPCPECGAGEDQDLKVYSLRHKPGCPRLRPGYIYPPRHSSPVLGQGGAR